MRADRLTIDKGCGLFGDYHSGQMGVCARDDRDDGGVGDIEVFDTDEPTVRINHSGGIIGRAHRAGPCRLDIVAGCRRQPAVQRRIIAQAGRRGCVRVEHDRLSYGAQRGLVQMGERLARDQAQALGIARGT